MEPIRLGILGAGSFVQRRILPILDKVDAIEPVSIWNRRLESGSQVATKFKIPKVASTREELLSDADIDAIFIATPNHRHEEDAQACAVAKKPTLCEKPLAPTVAEISRMQKSFQESGVNLYVGQSLRFKPAVEIAKHLLARGELGELQQIRAYFALTVAPENWRFHKSLGGGVLQDVGVHLVDLIRNITGDEFATIFAIADVEKQAECETTVSALGKLKSGTTFQFECSMNQHLRSGFELIGTDGRLVSSGSLRQTYDPIERLCLVRKDDSVTHLPLRARDIYEAEMNHFGAILKGQETSILDASEGMSNQKVIEAAYASILEKRPTTV